MTLTVQEMTKVFHDVLGIEPRAADLAVVELLGGTRETLAEYIWDHWLGEPNEPTVEDILRDIDQCL